MAKKPVKSQAMEYKGATIEVLSDKNGDFLKIDSTRVQPYRDADTGAYVCDQLPYQTFGTLEELAKAVVDTESGDRDGD